MSDNPFLAMVSKDAEVTVKLKADSGYRSVETHRISPSQWHRIVAILNEPTQAQMEDAQ